MYQQKSIDWLDLGIRDDSRPVLFDHGRLEQIASELPGAGKQNPSLRVFLGKRLKDKALQQLYPRNNVRRYDSNATIKLRYDIATCDSHVPVLFADSKIPQATDLSPLKKLQVGSGYPITWPGDSRQRILTHIWGRLIFMFAEIVCIFLDDFAELSGVIGFIEGCFKASLGNCSIRMTCPRIIVVYSATDDKKHEFRGRIDEKLKDIKLETFVSFKVVYIDEDLSDIARYQHLRAIVAEGLNGTVSLLEGNQYKASTLQLAILFRKALRHTVTDVDNLFDLARAVREERPVSPYLGEYLFRYFDAGKQARIRPRDLASSIASAALMDHYVPGMLRIAPEDIFRDLYGSAVDKACGEARSLWPLQSPNELFDLIQKFFVHFFHYMGKNACSSVEVRKEEMMVQSGRLSGLRSNEICLYCLTAAAQHVLECGHTLCDRCAQLFGKPSNGSDHQFVVERCLCCLYQRAVIIDVQPRTASPSILSIDGGGVRGVIPLEFLMLVEEHLYPCKIQDVIDLVIGTSSGGLIILGLFVMSWDVGKCSQTFEDLARRIFRERRHSPLLRLLSHMHGETLLGETARWIQWLFRDSCYDSRAFDTALREVFGEDRRLFGNSGTVAKGILRSGPKAGVITTSISRKTGTFVIGNFNVIPDSDMQYGNKIFLKAARATAAAPFYFTPVDLQGIGSFQDGGLKYNFAGEIATQVRDRIWSQSTGSTRLLSLGTGTANDPDDQTPYFRNIFRDSFVRRGFDTWMSSMETENDWRKFRNQERETFKPESRRLNVPLGDLPSALDDVGKIDEYRNKVITQPGSARMARDAATMLLVSRLYFEIGSLPHDTATPFWCRGTLRCRGMARDITNALDNLYPGQLDLFSDAGLIGSFVGTGGICSSCRHFNHPVSFLARHIDHAVDLYLQSSTKSRWRVGGFPTTVSTLSFRQKLDAPFGRDDHHLPKRVSCSICDVGGSSGLNRRRKRESVMSKWGGAEKAAC
ncbi:hypothetical protein N7481_008421 [Penicillium waksmanii]|uniref:uncharacterized protein n=1 Tax=Penicillium waksmanii TaxID=69791 RepID=UPI0025487402|nr:uncharacterized protein N7481_008421 [Penicillium waksmanii]KAJ5981123.1 hypothetical protein N7481_008421 [Penicillium waksmanii]